MNNPQSAEELFHSALDHIANNRPEEAIADFRAAIGVAPGMLDAVHGLIRAQQDAGHLDDAILSARSLIALDPDDVLAHTSLSILYQRKGMVPEAEAESAKAKILGWKHQLRAARR